MLLVATGLTGGYGPAQVLLGVDVEVGEAEVVAMVGRNGMGKTTTLRMLTGALAPKAGCVRFGGLEVTGLSAHRIARLGVGLVPEGRQVFPNLTVEEHLIVAARAQAGEGWSIERVLGLFPRLRERLAQMARTLSGGEQQMLAIGRALVGNPRLLILDEATEGLAPLVRREIWRSLEIIAKSGMSVLVVDKNIAALSRIARRVIVLSRGRTVWSGPASEFAQASELHRQHVGL